MSISQSDRYDLQRSLQSVLGEKMGNTLMEHLPPSGWSDVARTRDIDMVRQELRNDIDMVRQELRNLEVRMDARMDMFDLQLAQLSKRVSYAITTGVAMFGTLLALLIDLQFSV
ncbi:MAG: hypothetical protein ACKOFD_04800 [Actinomycetota bacterium]